jgi:hypothetical protein
MMRRIITATCGTLLVVLLLLVVIGGIALAVRGITQFPLYFVSLLIGAALAYVWVEFYKGAA